MDGDFDAFISHSSADAAIAHRVVETLEAKGVRCWVAPRDVRPGRDFQAEIVTALESVRCLILLFSDNANSSEHVHREVLLADNGKIPVYPVRIEDTHPSGAMKYQLANRQWLDYFEDRNRVLENLIGRIAQRRSVLPPQPGAIPQDQNAPQLPPAPPPDATDGVSDDGLRRTLPPALDPAYLLLQFKGRIGRRSFLFGLLVQVFALAALTLGWMAIVLQAKITTVTNSMSVLGFGALAFAVLYCSLSLIVKRLHDFGLSAWWSLLPIGAGLGATVATSLIAPHINDILNELGESSFDRALAVSFILLTTVSFAASLWLLFWPGKSSSNKYGPAPSFKKNWRPYDALAQRASARSEFDVPFVILSVEGRVGATGLATGVLFILWLGAVFWFFSIVANGQLNSFDDDYTYMSGYEEAPSIVPTIGRYGMVGTLLLAFVVFSCLVAKRLHDIGITAWVQAALTVVLVVVLTVLNPHSSTEGLTITGIFVAAVLAILFIIPGAKNFNLFGAPPGFRVDALREQKA